jgi:hypothetical protein
MLCNEALSVCRQYVAAWLQLPVRRNPPQDLSETTAQSARSVALCKNRKADHV